jgi:hypothetical protein
LAETLPAGVAAAVWQFEDTRPVTAVGRVPQSCSGGVLDNERELPLVIVDSVLGPPNEDPLAKFLDLMMLVSAGGHERTEEEWRALLADGGFELVSARRATPTRHVIEAAPV